jgi:hypothetical protein
MSADIWGDAGSGSPVMRVTNSRSASLPASVPSALSKCQAVDRGGTTATGQRCERPQRRLVRTSPLQRDRGPEPCYRGLPAASRRRQPARPTAQLQDAGSAQEERDSSAEQYRKKKIEPERNRPDGAEEPGAHGREVLQGKDEHHDEQQHAEPERPPGKRDPRPAQSWERPRRSRLSTGSNEGHDRRQRCRRLAVSGRPPERLVWSGGLHHRLSRIRYLSSSDDGHPPRDQSPPRLPEALRRSPG